MKVLNFADFWKQRTGEEPEELIFDSKLTTYANLNRLNQRDIAFITLRWHSPGQLRTIEQASPSAWRRIELEGVSRVYRTPWILEEDHVRVRLAREAHNPVLKEAGLIERTLPVPWLGQRPLVFDLPCFPLFGGRVITILT